MLLERLHTSATVDCQAKPLQLLREAILARDESCVFEVVVSLTEMGAGSSAMKSKMTQEEEFAKIEVKMTQALPP